MLTRLTWLLGFFDFSGKSKEEMEVHRDFADAAEAAAYKLALETLGFYVHTAEVPA